MAALTPDVERISKIAATRGGLTRLSERSGVPYTTLKDWERRGFRPPAVDAFERVAEAATAIEAAAEADQADPQPSAAA